MPCSGMFPKVTMVTKDSVSDSEIIDVSEVHRKKDCRMELFSGQVAMIGAVE